MLSLARRLLLLAVAVVLVIVGAGAWFYFQVNPLGSPGRPVLVVIRSGEVDSQLASALAARGVVSSGTALRIYLDVFGSIPLTPGNYLIDQNSSFGSVRSIFAGPPNAEEVNVEPGLTLAEVAARVGQVTSPAYQAAFSAAARAAAADSAFGPDGSLEGLIGPGTYLIRPHESASALVAAMTASFVTEAAHEGITATTRLHGLDAYQLVVAASIVQKEAYYNRNMTRVARVILNRLARGGGLQMDATILYYFHRDGGTVTSAMLRTPTPYNTYLHPGLTPTPICTPSAFALHAMVDPATGTWLYFTLITRSGTLAFATTFAQQLHNERVAASRGIT